MTDTRTRSEKLENLRAEIAENADALEGLRKGFSEAVSHIRVESKFGQLCRKFILDLDDASTTISELSTEVEKIVEHVCPQCQGEGLVLDYAIRGHTGQAVDCPSCGGEGDTP